jgi:hypothetical protein
MIEIIMTFAILPLASSTAAAENNEATTTSSQQQQQYPSFEKDEEADHHHHQKSKRRRNQVVIAPLNIFLLIKDHFDLHRSQIENFVFQSLRPFSTTEIENNDTADNNNNNNRHTLPSRVYTYDDFLTNLQTMAVDGTLGNSFHKTTNPYKPSNKVGTNDYRNDSSNKAFYLSQDDFSSEYGMTLALVNICAFLANAMVESIQFDSCDEWNGMMTGFDGTTTNSGWGGGVIKMSDLSSVNGRYFPLSNACGQNGRSYQDEDVECTIEDMNVSCDVDRLMDMRASVHPKYNYQPGQKTPSYEFQNQPPPEFACGVKDYKGDYTGYWDSYTSEFVQDVAYPSANGRIDVEGCCFWGRGALQTRGTCALGKFNYYFGKRAYDENRPARYPSVDFCKLPVSVCACSLLTCGSLLLLTICSVWLTLLKNRVKTVRTMQYQRRPIWWRCL